MKTTSRFAIAAAAGVLLGGIALSPAKAADLGGDCCADLEERVAELEATTARKGNRVVSLTVSGQVNRGVLFWDDGDEQNAYVVDNDASGTRFRFVGSAKIDPDWSAGYLLELEQQDSASNNVSQVTDDDERGPDVRYAYWYLKSNRLGMISLGQQSVATDGIYTIVLGNTVGFDTTIGAINGSFFIRRSDGTLSGVTWGAFDNTDEDGGRNDIVRYDSPTVWGFILSAAWGEDDTWDVALRYSKEWNSLRVAAGIGYRENTEGSATGNCIGDVGLPSADCHVVSGSISVMHTPSGIWAAFGAGEYTDENRSVRFGSNADDDDDFWSAFIGIQRKWWALGATDVFVSYYDDDIGTNNAIGVSGFRTGEHKVTRVGVVQEIDAAAMELYAVYENHEADIDGLRATTGLGLQDWNGVIAGARIKF